MKKLKKPVPTIKSLQAEIKNLTNERESLLLDIGSVTDDFYEVKQILDRIAQDIKINRPFGGYSKEYKPKDALHLIDTELRSMGNQLKTLKDFEGRYIGAMTREAVDTQNKLWYLLRVSLNDPSIPEISNKNPLSLKDGPFDDPQFIR